MTARYVTFEIRLRSFSVECRKRTRPEADRGSTDYAACVSFVSLRRKYRIVAKESACSTDHSITSS